MNCFVAISGCSGGGKSTLLAELAARGFSVVEEPGRRIVKQELEGEGASLPWVDLAAFARRAIGTSIADRAEAAANRGWTFFDRGLIDAAIALEHATGELVTRRLNAIHPYHSTVFMTPPWPDIYEGDPERRHSFSDAIAEYERLSVIYPVLGYEVVLLPKVSVAERADFVLSILG
ncbi:AAA family ATPase [Aliirhizobium smilacinae]|uniref:ATPase n=1 Tax=Aliirhizobium smilacinae TaxID=1395944 RepID=A0A5C4XHD5_9HYPH|nr:AAA family ATPase [Rhizobium smilacinae]TNM62935.1 ATPase [Rhizobium smilacinae]